MRTVAVCIRHRSRSALRQHPRGAIVKLHFVLPTPAVISVALTLHLATGVYALHRKQDRVAAALAELSPCNAERTL